MTTKSRIYSVGGNKRIKDGQGDPVLGYDVADSAGWIIGTLSSYLFAGGKKNVFQGEWLGAGACRNTPPTGWVTTGSACLAITSPLTSDWSKSEHVTSRADQWDIRKDLLRTWGKVSSVQFSSVSQLCPTLCDPWTAAYQASLSITNSWSLLKFMFIELMMPSNHFILCWKSYLLPDQKWGRESSSSTLRHSPSLFCPVICGTFPVPCAKLQENSGDVLVIALPLQFLIQLRWINHEVSQTCATHYLGFE